MRNQPDTHVVVTCPGRWVATLAVSRAVHGAPEGVIKKLTDRHPELTVVVGPWIVDGAETSVVHVIVPTATEVQP